MTSAIVAALASLRAQTAFVPAEIGAVMIGTTHFINALIEGKRLAPTAAIRFGLPATRALPPLVDWPQRLVDALGAASTPAAASMAAASSSWSAIRPR